nr:DNA polymerase III subunit chi [uncultured Desulfuromonas sp.]
MPPVVEFIKLNKPEKAKSLCLLSEEFFAQKKRILILVEDENQALTLDRFMWTWNKGSFLPHVWDNGAVECHEESIAIGTREHNSNGATVLIAARPCHVEFMRQFKHVIEFAETYDEALVEAARDRFRAWRECGCEPRMRK